MAKCDKFGNFFWQNLPIFMAKFRISNGNFLRCQLWKIHFLSPFLQVKDNQMAHSVGLIASKDATVWGYSIKRCSIADKWCFCRRVSDLLIANVPHAEIHHQGHFLSPMKSIFSFAPLGSRVYRLNPEIHWWAKEPLVVDILRPWIRPVVYGMNLCDWMKNRLMSGRSK